jgi:CheY-like chemotaxis protein
MAVYNRYRGDLMRILIVEDDVAGRFLLQQFLEPLGEIQVADDGEAAVDD